MFDSFFQGMHTTCWCTTDLRYSMRKSGNNSSHLLKTWVLSWKNSLDPVLRHLLKLIPQEPVHPNAVMKLRLYHQVVVNRTHMHPRTKATIRYHLI